MKGVYEGAYWTLSNISENVLDFGYKNIIFKKIKACAFAFLLYKSRELENMVWLTSIVRRAQNKFRLGQILLSSQEDTL